MFGTNKCLSAGGYFCTRSFKHYKLFVPYRNNLLMIHTYFCTRSL